MKPTEASSNMSVWKINSCHQGISFKKQKQINNVHRCINVTQRVFFFFLAYWLGRLHGREEDGNVWLQQQLDVFYVRGQAHSGTRGNYSITRLFFPPLERIFILNQKAHYSTHRLTCPLYPAEMWYGHIQKLMQLLTSKTGWGKKMWLRHISISCITLNIYFSSV